MEADREGNTPSSSMPGDRTRSQRKGTSLQKVNKVLVKGVKQLFANQKDLATESNGIQSTGVGLGVRRKSSLLRNYMLASEDEMSLVVPDSQRPSIADTSPLSRHVFSKPQSERRWYREPKRAGPLPTHIRPHFVPKGSRKSPEVSKKLLTNEALENRAGLVTTLPSQAGTNLRPEEGSWTELHDLQSFRPLEFVSHVGAKAILTPPLELGSETGNTNYLEIETDADEVKSKRKMRMEYSRLFTISSTFSRMRGLKKVKAEQPEVVRVPSPIPLTLSPDDSTGPVLPEHHEDVALLEGLKAEQALLQQKVLKISEEIRVKQSHRSANTSEYLHLISHTDRAQAFRLKEAFEKKNQYLSSVISQLQRRLESYLARQKQMERDASLMRENASSLLAIDGLQRMRSDYNHEHLRPDSPQPSEVSTNLLVQSDSDMPPSQRLHQRTFDGPFHNIDHVPLPDDEYSVITSFSADFQDLLGLSFDTKSSRANSLERQNMGYLSMLEELTEIKETQINLELNFKNIAEQYNQHYAAFEESLHEEKYRLNQLQAQLNDLIDLHQNEVLNLKSELASLEEKIAYQSYESSRDIWEVLENFQSKLMRLEQQQQQGELLDHVNTRQLLGKSMNLLLIIFAVLLMLMSTISALILPFIKTRMRTLSTIIVFVLVFLSWHNWDSLTAFSARRLMFRWR